MKKVGILSCYGWLLKTGNYGTLLQNYALQQTVTSLGYESIWVAVAPERKPLIEKMLYFFLRPHKLINALIHALKNKKNNNAGKSQEIDFFEFLDQHVPHTPYSPLSTLLEDENVKSLSAWIVGSDNVWTVPGDTYFLGFVPESVPKIAYAASAPWGHLVSDWSAKAAYSLKRLNAISVREQEGVKFVSEAGGDATVVLDPTLLLQAEDYEKVLTSGEVKQPYVFAYYVNPQSADDLRFQEICDYAKELDAEIKVSAIQGAEKSVTREHLVTLTPSEWLRHIRDAECVVTNSFHGMVFSIIFKRPFAVVMQKGATAQGNSRFFSLLSQLGLENRICSDDTTLKTIISSPVDWIKCEAVLTALRCSSLEFLSNSLKF
mgnify:CR=1 FL=1